RRGSSQRAEERCRSTECAGGYRDGKQAHDRRAGSPRPPRAGCCAEERSQLRAHACHSRIQWFAGVSSVPSRQVLIINCDDTVETRYTKTRVLRQAGYEVMECSTGQDALQKTRELMPDLVLLDVQLPDMSGLDVCRRIKEDAVTGIIPVIQISATFVTK